LDLLILASRRLTPSLTTISQHGVEIGEVAAKLLIDRLESKEVPYETVVIKTKLKGGETIYSLNCKWFYLILLTSFFSISCSSNYLQCSSFL
jgi:hypothetical protein